MREWTIGKDVPLNLATFNSVTTRSYAIIFVCMCKERFGPTEDYIILNFRLQPLTRVPELTAKVLLPTTEPLISDSARSPPATRPPSSSKTRFFFASQSR